VDFSSIAVIERAAIETYLTFFEVFIAPTSEDEFTFAWSLWELAGLVGMERAVAEDPVYGPYYEYDLKRAARARTQLEGTLVFQRLKGKAQEAATRLGDVGNEGRFRLGVAPRLDPCAVVGIRAR
jgi:hypothetical protein